MMMAQSASARSASRRRNALHQTHLRTKEIEARTSATKIPSIRNVNLSKILHTVIEVRALESE